MDSRSQTEAGEAPQEKRRRLNSSDTSTFESAQGHESPAKDMLTKKKYINLIAESAMPNNPHEGSA
eukprot:11927082-Prorocentrum_lima.AAC.1